jgi:hypothetical protein
MLHLLTQLIESVKYFANSCRAPPLAMDNDGLGRYLYYFYDCAGATSSEVAIHQSLDVGGVRHPCKCEFVKRKKGPSRTRVSGG